MGSNAALEPINETLGVYSQLFMLLAAMVYMVVFIFFALDLAKTNKSISEMDAAALKEDEKLLVSAGAVTRPARGRRGSFRLRHQTARRQPGRTTRSPSCWITNRAFSKRADASSSSRASIASIRRKVWMTATSA